MITAKELMTKDIISNKSTNSMLEAGRLMTEKDFKHLAVVDNGKLVGILSDRDIFKAMRTDKVNTDHMELSLNSTQKIRDYMSSHVYVVAETTSLEKVIEEFILQKVSAFIVEDMDGTMEGIITV